MLVPLSTGCVRSTAQWVVDKTTPNDDTNITAGLANQGPNSPIIFKEEASSAWGVLLSIGFLILACCSLPYIWSKNWFSIIKVKCQKLFSSKKQT